MASGGAAEGAGDGQLLRGRYRLLTRLGAGGQGTTWRARDEVAGGEVAVKHLRLEEAPDWKAIELFEREGRALASLDHPGIPRYIDAFAVEEAAGESFYLVQELVEGESLDALIRRGQRLDEAEARRVAIEVADILSYVHGRNPPVVHRDVKPSNIMRRVDGRVALIDFGAVAAALPAHTLAAGSTMVGTSGYMAPEQLLGRAVPASDLYGLGATLVHLLGHRHPATLPMRRLVLDWRVAVNVSEGFGRILDRLLAPAAEDRPGSAAEVVASLRGSAPGPDVAARPSRGRRVALALSLGLLLLGLAFLAVVALAEQAAGPSPWVLDELESPPRAPVLVVGPDGAEVEGLRVEARSERWHGGFLTLKALIHNESELEYREMEVMWRALDEDGVVLGAKRDELLPGYHAPFRPRDALPASVLLTETRSPPARVEIRLDGAERVPATPREPVAADARWEVAPPEGVALRFRLRELTSEQVRGSWRHDAVVEAENTGEVAIVAARLRFRVIGAGGATLDDRRFLLSSLQTALFPGEVRTVRFNLRGEAPLERWELAVVEATPGRPPDLPGP